MVLGKIGWKEWAGTYESVGVEGGGGMAWEGEVISRG